MTETFINEVLNNSNRTTRMIKDLKYVACDLYEIMK